MLATLRAFGLDPSRAQALVDRGYNALWKLARVKESDLARIPEVGPLAARKIFASFSLLNYAPPQRTKESVAQDEYECPLCGCLTSAYAPSCPECGASFDEEEMDEAIRRAFLDEGIAGLVAFYDNRLAQKPDDADLLYARGLLLDSFGRTDQAVESLERAASKAPDQRKFKVALLRIHAKHARKPEWSEKLRTTASSLLDDVAWDQEIAELDDLITRAGPACTECGRPLPEGAERCPSCGASVPAPEGAPAPREVRPSTQAPELDNLVDDLLVGELEESLSTEELERTKAAVLDWLIEELEESMRPDEKIVPEAKKPEGEKAVATPPSPLATSVGFLSGWMRGSRGLVSGMRPKREGRGTAGKVNGLVNGMGRVNGLVNGTGRVNGLVQPAGRVNGLVTAQGRVNGLVGAQGRINGIVNGTQFVRSGRSAVRLVGPSRRVRYAAIASGSLVAIVIFALLFIPVSGPTAPIAIDGSFSDWDAVPKLNAATQASNPFVSIGQYASLLDQNSLYLYATTLGGTFGDSTGYDGVYFLIDADGNASTGLSFEGIGADAVVSVFGANFTVAGARLYTFPANAEVNWSQRQPGGSVQSAASATGVEARVSTYDFNGFDPTAFRILVYADDFRGDSSRSLAQLSPDGGAVLLLVSPLTSTVGAGPTPLFTIRARALGTPSSFTWDVSSIQLNATPGVVVSLSAESVTLTQGQPNATITASVSAPGFLPGDAIQVDVLGASGTKPVFVHGGGPIRAYVVSPPSAVRIDGLFSDWVGRDVPDSDSIPVTNSDVNIVRYGAAVDPSTAFFHVAVAGEMLGGAVPERIVPSPRGQGGNASGRPLPLPRQTGEDILRVYIDLNASDPTGVPIAGIYADHMFEIRGLSGRITSRALYMWTGTWTKVALPANALAKTDFEIEGSVAVGPVTNTTRMVFEATDWSSSVDWTTGIGAPSLAPSSQFAPGPRAVSSPQAFGFGDSTFYLRDSDPQIVSGDCVFVKGLNTTRGGGGASITLSSGNTTACFFTDPASADETIAAGSWAGQLDLSTSSGTILNVTFAVTNQNGSSPSLVCWTNTNTTGGDDQLFSCSSGTVSITANQRIRLRVEYVSGPSIDLKYDGSGASQDSSITVSVPEFSDLMAPAFTTGVLVLLLSRRRRTRRK